MCILGLHPRDMAAMLVVNAIHHFQIVHNAPSIPPPPPKVYMTIVPNFSWVLQSSQEKSKTTVMKNLGGGGETGCVMVHVKMVHKNYFREVT